ncbi:hypothetical protein [Crossiella cryophila]|uniref:Uncharacterized protein n=1 Tax=Crossiella cryophila TaxID=43355 RepID=A0A7W7CCN7_9PSEU|nr:hypothetical protein [Crossiella cryophila]MBB4677448.1 hypothetical protein [Crossiella cryophila]
MVENEASQLVDELKLLRRRRALDSSNLADVTGPLLRRTLGLAVDGKPLQLREALRHELTDVARHLPDEQRQAVLMAYGLTDESAATANFTQRLELVANLIDRDPKTAKRHIDKALEALAKLMLVARRERRRPGAPWRTTSLHTSVVLDQGLPQVYERRRFVVSAEEVDEVELEVSVPLPPGWAGGIPPDSTGIEVLHGGTLQVRQRRSSARLGYVLRLPHKLPRHAEHEFFLQFHFTEQRLMRPFYVCTPTFPCELFELHVKFDPERVPDRIWRITDLPPSEVEDEFAPRELVKADPCGEVHFTFTDLTPNRSFGVVWGEEFLAESEATPGARRAP